MIKFNSGNGAILCDICSIMLKDCLSAEEMQDTSEHFCDNHRYLEFFSQDKKNYATFISENHSLEGYIGVSHGTLIQPISDEQARQNVKNAFVVQYMSTLDDLFDPEFDNGELKIWIDNEDVDLGMTKKGKEFFFRCQNRFFEYAKAKFGTDKMINI